MKTYSLIRNETGKYNIQKIDLCLISRKKNWKEAHLFFRISYSLHSPLHPLIFIFPIE